MNKLQFQEKMDSQLPTAQTCFFDLYLPSYSTEKIMKARLLCAISLESFDNSEDKDVVDVENVYQTHRYIYNRQMENMIANKLKVWLRVEFVLSTSKKYLLN